MSRYLLPIILRRDSVLGYTSNLEIHLRCVASRRVTQDSLLRQTRLILRLPALSLRGVPLAT